MSPSPDWSVHVLRVTICREFFQRAYRIGNALYCDCAQKIRDGAVSDKLCKINRDSAITISNIIMEKFQDDLAEASEFMPHDTIVGDHFEIFETDTCSQMPYDEKRFFPSCYTYQTMYDMYTDRLNESYPACKEIQSD